MDTEWMRRDVTRDREWTLVAGEEVRAEGKVAQSVRERGPLPGYRAREEERVPRRARRVSRRAVVVVRAVGCREYSVVRDERGCNFAPPEAFSYTVMKDAGR